LRLGLGIEDRSRRLNLVTIIGFLVIETATFDGYDTRRYETGFLEALNKRTRAEEL
jgi:hypothetical protein